MHSSILSSIQKQPRLKIKSYLKLKIISKLNTKQSIKYIQSFIQTKNRNLQL